MHSEEPLFSQAILLGGSFLMMKPATEKTAEQLYEAIIQDLGLSENAAEDRVRLLRTMPAEKLVSNLTTAFVSLGPVVDHDFVPAAATFSGLSNDAQLHLPGRNWCQRLLVIDSQLDVSTTISPAICVFGAGLSIVVGLHLLVGEPQRT